MSGKGSHGGARENSGRKPKYEMDNETVTLRVPKTQKEQVDRMLQIIDDLVAQGFTIEQIESLLNDTLKK